jgi:hypothetical protein
MDWVHCNTGREGSGKTTLAMLSCMQFENFCVDNIAFTGKEFHHLLLKVPEGSAVLFDEGAEGLFSRDSMNKFNKMIVKTLMAIRGRNLFIVINIPDFTSLDRGLRNRRVMSLSETRYVVGKDMLMKRGIMHFYDASKLDSYYRDDRGLLHAPQPTWVDTFHSIEEEPIWQEYVAKKNLFYADKVKKAEKASELEENFKGGYK